MPRVERRRDPLPARSCPWILALALIASTPAAGDSPPFAEFFDADGNGSSPSQMSWAPDGRHLAYLWDDGNGDALWILDGESGERQRRLKLGKNGAPEDVDEYRWAPDSGSLCLLGSNDLYLLSRDEGRIEQLTATDAVEEDPKFSPAGDRLAFVRGEDLVVLELESRQELRLTQDGKDNEILNGKTDWVYWEELWGRDSTGFWWHPQGTHIAYYRFEEAAVATYPLVDYEPRYPQVTEQKYPKTGQTNPTVRVGVIPADGGETTWLQTGDPAAGYLARVHWTAGGEVAVEHLSRDQDHLQLLLCSAGDGRCRQLLEERSETWINIENETTFLPDGRFLWGSERDGWRQLYLYEADGRESRQLTSGTGHVTSLDAVADDGSWIAYTTHGRGPLGAKDRRVMRLPLTGGEAQPMSQGEGWHGAQVAAASGRWVHSWSTADTPARHVVRGASGQEVADISGEAPTAFSPPTLPAWEFLTIPGPNGVRLPARMLKPPGFDPNRSYPAVVYHYGGPESQVVVNRWGRRNRDLWHKWMALRGYVVLMADSETSVFFGKDGADRVHRRFGEFNLAAQLAVVDYLRSTGFVDTARLGLWGWSGGGSNTLNCMLRKPGVWRAGVVGAPVTDWHFYDTIWTERYLDHPEDNVEGYRLSSAVTYAEQLKDAVLIVHGTADDNVHPQNTMVLSKRWIDAGLPFEQAIYPGQKHGFKGPEFRHFLQRMTEFFDRHLRAED